MTSVNIVTTALRPRALVASSLWWSMVFMIICVQWITVSARDDDVDTHFRLMDTSSGTFIYGPTRKGNAGYWVLGGIAVGFTVAFLVFAFVRRNNLDTEDGDHLPAQSIKRKPGAGGGAGAAAGAGAGDGIEMTSTQSSPRPAIASPAPVATAAPIISRDDNSGSPRKDVTWSYVMDYQSAFPTKGHGGHDTLHTSDEHKVDISKSEQSHDVHFVLHE